MPKLTMPGALLVGDSAGMVDTVALKGVHHCINSGILAAEAIYEQLKRGGSDFSAYEQAVEESSIGKELYEVRNTRQPFQKGFLQGGPLVNAMIATKGRFPGGRWSWHRNDDKPMFIGNTKDSYPKPDGKYTFDKLSSVYITGNATRDDAPEPHPRAEERPARDRRDVDVDVPGRRLRDPRRRARARQRGPDRELHELRPVRGDHRQGRPPDAARGRRRAAVPSRHSAATSGARPC